MKNYADFEMIAFISANFHANFLGYWYYDL